MRGLRIFRKGKIMMAAMLLILLATATIHAQHQNPSAEAPGDTAYISQEILNCEAEEEYNAEIQSAEIPPAVSSEILETYPGHEIAKAYQAPDGSYKVNIDKGNEKVVVSYSINGELLNEENLQDSIDDW